MAWFPEESLVIAISSRALFDLDVEDRIYREQRTDAFIQYQRDHEEQIIAPGVAFSLVRSLLELNGKLGIDGRQPIEVVIVSKNHPDCLIRIQRSLEFYGLPIKRACLTGGQPTLPYLQALNVDLFLSKEEGAVKEALAAGFSAGLIFGSPTRLAADAEEPVIAIDGDAVLFSDQSESKFREGGLEQFAQFERENAQVPLPPGPLHRFARALSELQAGSSIEEPPFRIALVTARDLTYCERPIRTLRSWGIRMDQAFFVSDMSKRVMLAALNPLIFFDDSEKHCTDAATAAPTVQIPYPATQQEQPAATPLTSPKGNEVRSTRFMGICKLYLGKDFAGHEQALWKWHDENLSPMDGENFELVLAELGRSVKGTPKGRQRRSSSTKNSNADKLLFFLGSLAKKYRHD